MELFLRWAWGDEHNMEQNTSNQGFLGHGGSQISPNVFRLIRASTAGPNHPDGLDVMHVYLL